MSTITTACPLDCPDGCSLSITVEDERITAIDAVPEGEAANPLTDGWICRKVRRMTRRIHGDQRLTTPLRRTGPKGSGQFEPLGWDEALDEIAAHIRTAIDEHGPSSVVPYLYNSSAAVLESDGLTPLLFEALEAAEVEHTICAATASKAWRLVLGTMPSADPTDVADSDLIVVWGANPTVSNSHLAPRIEARAREGAKVVVIDPRRTPAADRASRFLPVKPGTDVVLAMAAAAELERRGAVDRAFVDEHAEGADEYLAACAEWTVERAAEVCGLEPEDITGFVDDIVGAQAPMLRVGWGMERNRNGGSAHRATMSLWVLAGAFGRPGAGVVGATSPAEDPTAGAVRNAVLGGGDYPNRRIVNMNRFGAVLAGEGGAVDVLFVQGSNPAASAPNQPAVHEGLARDDLFTVVHDQVMTDTARFADIVLPATTSFEVDDIVAGYGGYWVQDSPAVIPPVGESRPNNQVAHGLAIRLGLESEAFDPSPARLRALMVGPFELPLRLQPEGAVQFKDLWPAHAGSTSRKARLVTDDPTSDRLPTYRDNDVTGGSLILLTPATNRTITSMFGEYDSSDPSVHLHPADAESRGLTQGQQAVVTNGQASITVAVAVDDAIRPGVASIPKGLWCKATPEGLTANAFAPDTLSDLAGGARFNDAMVEVQPA
ncbi:MAG TPA: molybdopterin-dependent oxidoreductase [Acidimicrobiales bacterium]